MNNQDAIKTLKEYESWSDAADDTVKEALEMAVEALNPVPELKEIVWMRKLKRSILDGKCSIEVKTASGATSENLNSAAARAIADHAEFETGRYIKHLNDHIDYLREQLRDKYAAWIFCADGKNYPKKDGEYLATIEVNHAFAHGVYTDMRRYGIYGWELKTHDYRVIAWMPKPAPYNPDHIRDTTKKVEPWTGEKKGANE